MSSAQPWLNQSKGTSNSNVRLPPPLPPAIAMLKDKEPGSFIVRDSHSFRGAYGLAMKVATPPPSVLQLNKKGEVLKVCLSSLPVAVCGFMLTERRW